ncbi:MAG: ribonucleotide-diphosphate reductase subunit beta [Patescibacteria group bacterium]
MTNQNQLLSKSNNTDKYVVFHKHVDQDLVEMCDKQEANIWLSSDINLTHDADDWNKLSTDEQSYLKQVLAFFAGADGIVGENLCLNFIQEIQVPEVRYFYYFQSMMEAVHSKTYSQLINTFIKSDEEKNELFQAIEKNPIIKKKADWCFKYMDSKLSFSERILGFLAVEGIFFAGSFAAIFWIRNRGYLANSLGVANEYISRDETLHGEFAALLYKKYCNDLPYEKVVEILITALEIEKDFISNALPVKLIGMNQELMNQYLEFVVDMWLTELGLPKHFNTEQPFDFMNMIGQRRKDNFFEKSRTNYARQTTSQALDFESLTF